MRWLCPARSSRPPKRQPIPRVPTTPIRKSLDLPFRIEPSALVFFHSEYMLFFREYSVSNVSCKVLKGVLDHSRNVYVTLSELWLEARVQSDDLMQYQHLAVAKPP